MLRWPASQLWLNEILSMRGSEGLEIIILLRRNVFSTCSKACWLLMTCVKTSGRFKRKNNFIFIKELVIVWVDNLTNRFYVAVRLFSNRSQMTSKCGKNKKVAHEVQPSVSRMFLPHFDVICDLLLNRRTATWNLFVLYNKKIKIHGKNALLFQISPLWQTRK